MCRDLKLTDKTMLRAFSPLNSYSFAEIVYVNRKGNYAKKAFSACLWMTHSIMGVVVPGGSPGSDERWIRGGSR